MLEWTVIVTATISLLSGAGCLYFGGDWRHVNLKFAAVMLSTITAGYMLFIFASTHAFHVCAGDEKICMSWGIYTVFRNLAFSAFHIAYVLDIIKYRGKKRIFV